MRKRKYDWEDLKKRFFDSEYWDISEFIRHELGIDRDKNGYIVRATTGWRIEKIKYYQKIMNDFKPSFETTKRLHENLEKACNFLSELIKGWMIGKTRNIKIHGKYPTIKEIREFADLIEPFSKFGLGGKKKGNSEKYINENNLG